MVTCEITFTTPSGKRMHSRLLTLTDHLENLSDDQWTVIFSNITLECMRKLDRELSKDIPMPFDMWILTKEEDKIEQIFKLTKDNYLTQETFHPYIGKTIKDIKFHNICDALNEKYSQTLATFYFTDGDCITINMNWLMKK